MVQAPVAEETTRPVLGVNDSGSPADSTRGCKLSVDMNSSCGELSREWRAQRPYDIHIAVEQKLVKGEDKYFIHRAAGDADAPECGEYDVIGVADGHQGEGAAVFVENNFLGTLAAQMPKGGLPKDPSLREVYAKQVKLALRSTFVLLDKQWSWRNAVSGTTLTVAVVTGTLLTVANVGDSTAVMVLPNTVVDLTADHRVQTSRTEQARLRGAGAWLAPVSLTMAGPADKDAPGIGPMRIWPGGLCVSRAIGDIDVGPVVVPHPNVTQVEIPLETGARVALASDGVWDCLNIRAAAKVMRNAVLPGLPARVIDRCVRANQGFLHDDTTILIVDFEPHATARPSGAAPDPPAAARTRPPSRGGLFACCFAPPPPLNESPDGTPIPPGLSRDGKFKMQPQKGVNLPVPSTSKEDTLHMPDTEDALTMFTRVSSTANGAVEAARVPSRKPAMVSPFEAPADSPEDFHGLANAKLAAEDSLTFTESDGRTECIGAHAQMMSSATGPQDGNLHRFPSDNVADFVASHAIGRGHVAPAHDVHHPGDHTVHAGNMYAAARAAASPAPHGIRVDISASDAPDAVAAPVA